MESVDQAITNAVQRLGYHELRPSQLEAVRSFMQGRDVLITLPAGSGKSLCYAVLPYAFDELTSRKGSIVIVVSPSKNVMKDQVTWLTAKGLSALVVPMGIAEDKNEASKVREGHYQLLFISPELLLTDLTLMNMIATNMSRLVAFVVDEVHCVTKWEHFVRKEFGKRGEVRCMIPSHVHMMAMTGAATTETKKKVISVLGLKDPVLVSMSPDKANISYWVRDLTSVEKAFGPLLEKLYMQRTKLPRVIINCQRPEDCADIYQFFCTSLKTHFTDPVGAPNLARFRLVDMYHSVTCKDVQSSIVTSMCRSDSPLRILACTAAFGMDIDCVDVQQVVHWRPSPDVESYLQEVGRAGRNGEPSNALIFAPRQLARCKSSEDMKKYCSNKAVCRRVVLFSYLGCDAAQVTGCKCCDVCALTCSCNSCNVNDFPVGLSY